MDSKRYDLIRKFNKAILNRVTKLIAGRFFYSLVYHRGRHSGKAYSTPVIAVRKKEYIYIPLPYGADTDWVLNVQAGKQCDVKIKGKLYHSTTPDIVDSTMALPVFLSIFQLAFKGARVDQFLRLRI